jgi:hypothetical protein
MEIVRLIAVHFGVAATMGLGFVVAPMAKRLLIAAADAIFERRRRSSERWLLEVRALDDILAKRPTWQTYDPLHRGARSVRSR